MDEVAFLSQHRDALKLLKLPGDFKFRNEIPSAVKYFLYRPLFVSMTLFCF